MELVSKVQMDYLIVGQGITRSLVVLNLLQRGKTMLVIGDGHQHTASRVAAGLIKPITGCRHAFTLCFLEFWDFLPRDYARWEELLRSRFLKNEDGQPLFERKLKAGKFTGIDVRYPGDFEDVPFCKYRQSRYQRSQTVYFDQPSFIHCVRQYLESKSALRIVTWSDADFSREADADRFRKYL